MTRTFPRAAAAALAAFAVFALTSVRAEGEVGMYAFNGRWNTHDYATPTFLNGTAAYFRWGDDFSVELNAVVKDEDLGWTPTEANVTILLVPSEFGGNPADPNSTMVGTVLARQEVNLTQPIPVFNWTTPAYNATPYCRFGPASCQPAEDRPYFLYAFCKVEGPAIAADVVTYEAHVKSAPFRIAPTIPAARLTDVQLVEAAGPAATSITANATTSVLPTFLAGQQEPPRLGFEYRSFMRSTLLRYTLYQMEAPGGPLVVVANATLPFVNSTGSLVGLATITDSLTTKVRMAYNASYGFTRAYKLALNVSDRYETGYNETGLFYLAPTRPSLPDVTLLDPASGNHTVLFDESAAKWKAKACFDAELREFYRNNDTNSYNTLTCLCTEELLREHFNCTTVPIARFTEGAAVRLLWNLSSVDPGQSGIAATGQVDGRGGLSEGSIMSLPTIGALSASYTLPLYNASYNGSYALTLFTQGQRTGEVANVTGKFQLIPQSAKLEFVTTMSNVAGASGLGSAQAVAAITTALQGIAGPGAQSVTLRTITDATTGAAIYDAPTPQSPGGRRAQSTGVSTVVLSSVLQYASTGQAVAAANGTVTGSALLAALRAQPATSAAFANAVAVSSSFVVVTPTPTPSPSVAPAASSSLSGGAIAGIVVACVVAAVVIAGAAFHVHKQRFAAAAHASKDAVAKAPAGGVVLRAPAGTTADSGAAPAV